MSYSLHLGDCLDVLPTLEEGSVDMVLTDLPYGTTACKWDAVIPFEPLWKEYKRVAKEHASFVFTSSQPFTSRLVDSNIQMFRHSWVWNKAKAANFVLVKKQPLKVHEDIVVFGTSKSLYTPQMVEGKVRTKGGYPTSSKEPSIPRGGRGAPANVNGLYYPKSIIDLSVAGNKDSRLHPTQKPVDLMEYLIKTYSNEGDLVLDATMGSGSTGVACANTGRRFVGIEKEPDYFATAERRVKEAYEARQEPVLDY